MPKKSLKNNLILFFSFFLTMLIVAQIRIVKDQYLYTSLKSIKVMEDDLSIETEELSQLNQLKEEKQRELDAFLNIKKTENSSELLTDILLHRKMQAGYQKVKGKGVIIELMDSEDEVGDGENPNNLLIHDQDILILLNDLKVAGAEALSVNGQRIVAESEVKCSGATITINGTTYGQPFIVKAIGDPKQLEAAVLSPDSYGDILQKLYHIKVKTEIKDSVEIVAFEK
jgi:division initiation protein